MKIEEYGIEGYKHSQVYIDNPEEVLKNIVEKRSELSAKMEEKGMRVLLSDHTDANVKGIQMFENGTVVYVANTIPCDANRYDDFSSARMYLFKDGEIHYVFDEVDTRIEENKDANHLNKDIMNELNARLGKKVRLDESVFISEMERIKGLLEESAKNIK